MTKVYTPTFYQEDVINYGIENPYFINAMEQGLGKTFVSIEIAKRTKSKTLIVCPSYLKLKWKKEIHKFFPEAIVSLFHSSKDFYELWDTDFAIISYAFLEKAEVFFAWADFIVYDEAHSLKTMKAKRTEAGHRFTYEYSIKRISLLTGTPIQNRVYELYSLITLCQYNPKIEESAFLAKFPTYVDFADYFSYPKEYEINVGNKRVKVKEWSGYKNIEELKEWMKGCYIRKEADLLNLPPFIDIDVPVEYSDYPELMVEFEKYTDAEKSVKSPIKIKAALAKVPFTVDFVKDLVEKGLQVVVYSDHPEVAQAISDGLGLRYKAINGQTHHTLRQNQADKFQSGEQQVIVATIGSFKEGIDLYSACHMVFNDPNWVPGNMAQVKARIRRLGQKNRCTYYYIVGSYQDEYIYNKLAEKTSVIKAVI